MYIYIYIYICILIARAEPFALAAPGNSQRRCRVHSEFMLRAPFAAVVKKKLSSPPCHSILS